MNPEQGQALLRKACEVILRRDVTGSLVQKSIAAADQGNISSAIELALQAMNSNSGYMEPMVLLASFLRYDPAQHYKSRELYQQVIDLDPANSLSLWYLICDKIKCEGVEAVLSMLMPAVLYPPVDTYLVLTLSWIYIQMGNLSAASSHIQKLLQKPGCELICPTLVKLILSQRVSQHALPERKKEETVQCLLDLSPLCQPSVKYDQVFRVIAANKAKTSPFPHSLRGKNICYHLLNPALIEFEKRYGRKVVEIYSNDFFNLFLGPEIRMGFQRNNLTPKRNQVECENIPLEMILVPGGEYNIGCNEPRLKHPERKYVISSFLIDRYPVTNQQWRRFQPQFTFAKGLENHPVVNISYLQAAAYARFTGKRIPTEVEWEAAARGIDGRPYPWGQKPDIKYANCAENKQKKATPVTQFPHGAASCGAIDMVGNVFEWVDELDFKNARQTQRLVKGGCWTMKINDLKCWNRTYFPPDGRLLHVGFRCVKDI